MTDLAMAQPRFGDIRSLFHKATKTVGPWAKKIGKGAAIVALFALVASGYGCVGMQNVTGPTGAPVPVQANNPDVETTRLQDGSIVYLNTRTGDFLRKTEDSVWVGNKRTGQMVRRTNDGFNDYYKLDAQGHATFLRRTQNTDPITGVGVGIASLVANVARGFNQGIAELQRLNNEAEAAAVAKGYKVGSGPGGAPSVSISYGTTSEGGVRVEGSVTSQTTGDPYAIQVDHPTYNSREAYLIPGQYSHP